MKMQATYGYRILTCEIETDKNISVYNAFPTEFHDDTLCYAARRFLCGSVAVCRQYVKESYEMRVEKGRGKKRRRYRVIAPAAALELGRGWTVIDLCVSAAGVAIKRVALLDRYPER